MTEDTARLTENATEEAKKTGISRRDLLATAATGLGALMVADNARGAKEVAAPAPAQQAEVSGEQRRLISELGERSPYEGPRRLVGNVLPSSASKTPLQDLDGIITPSDLHYERHHSGIPTVDPDKYRLRIDGLVERPATLSLQQLKKLPRRSEIRYMECGNNGIPGFAGGRPDLSPQQIDGMVSTSEWTGTTLADLWELVRPTPEATWFHVEGYDGGWTGSIPMSERWDDSLIAWGQNGEAIRPEQGYPARLLLAGHPGGPNIKWISHIEIKGGPIPEQTQRDFSSVFGAKSLITSPAYPEVLEQPGKVTITGLAWSGRGKIARVDVSTDGGASWAGADLHRETRKDIRHYYNNIRAWAVATDGVVTFGNS
jgi:sulfane dehydrogenase subunit SoxC